MLTHGNVHWVVPKGTKTGLNGDSVQPTGTARECRFGLFLNVSSTQSFRLLLTIDPHAWKTTSSGDLWFLAKTALSLMGMKNRAEQSSQTIASDAVIFV
jgi:hypothetical protein